MGAFALAVGALLLTALLFGEVMEHAQAKVITMKVLDHHEVQEYHKRRRLQLGGEFSNTSAHLGARRLQGHVAFENKRVMEGYLAGNTMPLGYYYVRVHLGTPGQAFTVIVDTGSSLLAVPCTGCNKSARAAPQNPNRPCARAARLRRVLTGRACGDQVRQAHEPLLQAGPVLDLPPRLLRDQGLLLLLRRRVQPRAVLPLRPAGDCHPSGFPMKSGAG